VLEWKVWLVADKEPGPAFAYSSGVSGRQVYSGLTILSVAEAKQLA